MEGSPPSNNHGDDDNLTRFSILFSMSLVSGLGFVHVLILIHHVLHCFLLIDASRVLRWVGSYTIFCTIDPFSACTLLRTIKLLSGPQARLCGIDWVCGANTLYVYSGTKNKYEGNSGVRGN